MRLTLGQGVMNKKTYSFKELVYETGLSERNVRYYIYELTPRTEREKGSQTYPKSVRDTLVFVSMLREEMKKNRTRLSLEGIRQVLKDLASSVEAVADGLEPLVLSGTHLGDIKKVAEEKAQGEETLQGNTKNTSAQDYIRQNKAAFSSSEAASHAPPPSEQWQTVTLGKDVELRLRGNYSKQKLDQLALLGQFVDSILKDDKNNA